jgi:hypothetical protein
VTTTKRLHSGLLVDAEHDASLRRVQVKLADFRHFAAKVGVRAVQPQPDAMWPDAISRENPKHARSADRHPGVLCDEPRTKRVERPNVSITLARVRRGTACHRDQLTARHGINAYRSPRSWPIKKPLDSTSGPSDKPIAPSTNELHAETERLSGRAYAGIDFEPKDNPCTVNKSIRKRPLPDNVAKVIAHDIAEPNALWPRSAMHETRVQDDIRKRDRAIDRWPELGRDFRIAVLVPWIRDC